MALPPKLQAEDGGGIISSDFEKCHCTWQEEMEEEGLHVAKMQQHEIQDKFKEVSEQGDRERDSVLGLTTGSWS